MDIPLEYKLNANIERFFQMHLSTRPPDIGNTSSNRNGIWLLKKTAVKAAKPGFYQNGGLVNDAIIGRNLSKNGINAPYVYGLGLWENNLYFFVMERICLTPLTELDNEELDIAIISLKEQLKKVYELGYVPYECATFHNTGFCRKRKVTYLFDFEYWEKRDAFTQAI